MNYVYIATCGLKYIVRFSNSAKSYKGDIQQVESLGEKVVKCFEVPSELSGNVLKLAEVFVDEHNNGKKPQLRILNKIIDDLEIKYFKKMYQAKVV